MKETQQKVGILKLDSVLAVLVGILSVLTAYAAFTSASISSTSTDNYFLAQSLLNDANSLFIERGQDIIYDFTAFDAFFINAQSNPDISDYYYAQLSDPALDSLERPEGPFDQAYFDAMYAVPNEILVDEAAAFERAAHDSNRAVAYQLTVLINAVGLSFAAWASLAAKENRLRSVFAILAVLAGIVGLIQMLLIPG